jgi:hypothetical protein
MTGIWTPNPPQPSDNVTSQIGNLTLAGVTSQLNALNPGTASFPCTAGQTYSIVEIDVNANGDSLPGPALTGVVPTIPTTGVPTTPANSGTMTFTNP